MEGLQITAPFEQRIFTAYPRCTPVFQFLLCLYLFKPSCICTILTLKNIIIKSYKKNYIGKGTQIENIEIVKVTLKMEDLLKFKYEYEGNEYITFEIAKMKQEDKFERTHTVYVSQLIEADESAEN